MTATEPVLKGSPGYSPGSYLRVSDKDLARRIRSLVRSLEEKAGMVDKVFGMDSPFLNQGMLEQGEEALRTGNKIAEKLERWPKKTFLRTYAALTFLGSGMDLAADTYIDLVLGKWFKFDHFETVMKLSKPAWILKGLFMGNFGLDTERLKTHLPEMYGWDGKDPYPKTMPVAKVKQAFKSLLNEETPLHLQGSALSLTPHGSFASILEDYESKFESPKGNLLFALYSYQAIFGRPKGESFQTLSANLRKPDHEKWIRPGKPGQFKDWSKFNVTQLGNLLMTYMYWFGMPKGENDDEQSTHMIRKLNYHFNRDKTPFPEDPNWIAPPMITENHPSRWANFWRWNFPYIFNPVWEELMGNAYQSHQGIQWTSARSFLPEPDYQGPKLWMGSLPEHPWMGPGEQAPKGSCHAPDASTNLGHPGLCPWESRETHDKQGAVRPYLFDSACDMEREKKEREERQKNDQNIMKFWGTLTSI